MVTGVVPLLIGIIRDAVIDLQARTILICAIDNVETLCAVEDCHLATVKLPVLVCRTGAGLNIDNGTTSGTLCGEAKAIVQTRLDCCVAIEGRRLGGSDEDRSEGDQRREHRGQ